jgi:hypothetical protein
LLGGPNLVLSILAVIRLGVSARFFEIRADTPTGSPSALGTLRPEGSLAQAGGASALARQERPPGTARGFVAAEAHT